MSLALVEVASGPLDLETELVRRTPQSCSARETLLLKTPATWEFGKWFPTPTFPSGTP